MRQVRKKEEVVGRLTTNILRGEEKIGENLIEVTDGESTILLECGTALYPTPKTDEKEKRVVESAYDGIIVSHYHDDHAALLKYPLKAKHIYMGRGAYQILEYRKGICDENKAKVRFLQDCQPFSIGAIVCKPYLCDHSAYDSYMIELSLGDQNVLYTGDFRANGRKSFEGLLCKLPTKTTRLIIEGTTPTYQRQTERLLEEKAAQLFKKYDRVFVLQSSLNVDRLVSFYRASKQAGKPFIMGMTAADVCAGLPNIPNPLRYADCYTYLSTSVMEGTHKAIKEKYKDKLLGRSEIAKKGQFVMLINAYMLHYLQSLKEKVDLKGSVLIYSMWQGYKEEMQDFLGGVRDLGINVVDLHVSGHADIEAVKKVIIRTNPQEVNFVHTSKDDSLLWEALLWSMQLGKVNDSFIERKTQTGWGKVREAFLELEKRGYIRYDKGYRLLDDNG